MSINESNLIFETIHETLLKHLETIKTDASCRFSLDEIFDIDDLRNPDLMIKNNESIFQLQIRENYILQVVQKEVVKEHKTLIVDTIVSGIAISEKVKFEIKREYQSEIEPIPDPIGIILYLNENEEPLDLISEDSIEKLEAFEKILESKFVVQKGFHKVFKPLRKIGKGSSATVIEGKDLRDQQHYAIKGFKRSQGYSFERGIAFKELQFYKQNNHPHLIRLNSAFETENSIYMVLDKYDENLYDFLTCKGLNSEYELKAIMKGILEALEFLHSKSIMHRDIKPENVMIGQKEFDKKEMLKRKTDIVPVLIDFGFAENENTEEFTVYRCGTPGFIAPEILSDCFIGEKITDSFNSERSTSKRKYGKACDIFSLGCLFHLLLTNKMPFWGKNKNELLKQNAGVNIDPSSKEYKLLDKSAKNLLFRMLEKDPEKRISASEALKDDFFRLEMFNFRKVKFKNPLAIIESEKLKDAEKEEKQLQEVFLFQ